MATSSLRFILLGDDKASAAFSRFAREVDKSNRAVDRSSVALGRQSSASSKAQGSITGLSSAILGLGGTSKVTAGKMETFSKVLAGINLATGILEPAAASLVVTIGTMAAAAAGAAVGLGAYGLVLGNVAAQLKKLKELQKAAATGNKAAGQALQLYIKGLTPAFKAFNNQLDATKESYKKWGRSLEAPVLGPLTKGLKLVKPLLDDLSPAVKIASAAIGGLVDRLGKSVRGGGLARFLAAIKPAIGSSITGIGIAIGHIVVGLGGIIKAFAPFVPKFVHGLDAITAKFAKWGQTLTSHSGFQSLIGLWTKSGPQVNKIFANLVTILANVGKNMAGLATPANSAALLNILTPLSGIIAKLSENQGLVKFVLYFGLLKSTLKQFTPVLSTAGSALGVTSKLVSDISGAGGLAGWLKQIKLVTIAQKIWNGVQVVFNIIMRANPIGLIITAIGLLVVGVIYAYKHFKWFRDFVDGVWKLIQAGAVVLWHGLQKGWDAVWHAVVSVAKWFADRVLGFFGILLHGAAAAFGWIPVIGDKLKGAAAAFDRFHDRVDKALSFHDKTVSVGVKLSPVGAGPIAGKPVARGGLITGGIAGQDSVPGLLMPGEVVVPAHMVRAGVVNHLRGKLPGFASGGMVGGLSVTPSLPSVPAMAAAALTVIRHLARRNIASLMGGAMPGGAGVARWAGVILTALRLLGQSAGWLGLVERRMNQESGGNPYAINKWDSNWAAGTPSVGLMQVIGPTFAAYAGPFRGVGPFAYGTSENPLANVYAGLNYAIHRYGTLAALGQPGGYDHGGLWMPGQLGINTSGRPEMVRSASQEDALVDRLDGIAGLISVLIDRVDAVAPATASGVSRAFGGVSRSAMHSALYGAR